ncbi:MAG TPA: hypothetical protein VL242_05450, partial [Sorangium sp.]|nr:hypothetical protein [Sorangium sp.]
MLRAEIFTETAGQAAAGGGRQGRPGEHWYSRHTSRRSTKEAVKSKTKNTKTRPQIAAMVARAFGGMKLADSEDAVLELKEGWFNAAYDIRLADGQQVILKIAPPRDAEV